MSTSKYFTDKAFLLMLLPGSTVMEVGAQETLESLTLDQAIDQTLVKGAEKQIQMSASVTKFCPLEMILSAFKIK